MAFTPPPFNTKGLDPLADLCQDLGLGMAAPTISVVYDDFQLEFLEVGIKNYIYLSFNICRKNSNFFFNARSINWTTSRQMPVTSTTKVHLTSFIE